MNIEKCWTILGWNMIHNMFLHLLNNGRIPTECVENHILNILPRDNPYGIFLKPEIRNPKFNKPFYYQSIAHYTFAETL